MAVFVYTDMVYVLYISFWLVCLLCFFSVKHKVHSTGEGQAGNRLAASYTTMSKYLKVFTVPTDTQWI